MGKKYFITGIGTDVGKTMVSSVIVEALQADYYKPIQCGDLHYSDTDKIREWTSVPSANFHPSTYALKTPASPHYAADCENVKVELAKFKLPSTQNHLIVEGAGGLMVPLNDKDLVIDLIKKFQVEVILVSRNYLGSINHTLLSLEALQLRGIPVKGIIFGDVPNEATESIILSRTGITYLGRILQEEVWNKERAKHYAEQFQFLKD